jgi:two-component system, NarL family, nitrate/nitrite response regulator NarL
MLRSNRGFVVVPNPIFREGLVRLLIDASGMPCTGFSTLDDDLETKLSDVTRSLFLIDLGLDCQVVSQGIGWIRQRLPEAVILILSERYSHDHLLAALRAGAAGYLLSNISCETLVKSLELAALGKHVLPEQAMQLLCNQTPIDHLPNKIDASALRVLSAREVDVLKCLSRGMSNKIIARQWSIAEATVKVHVKAILRKIQVANRTEAARWAWDHGVSMSQSGSADESKADHTS